MKRILLVIFVLTTVGHYVSAQHFMLKTNLLYTGTTFTPNLGAEIRLYDRSTLDLKIAYNPWNLKGSADNNKKLVHWMAQAEFRYRPRMQEKFVTIYRTNTNFFQGFEGHFFGVHLLASQYNVGQRNLDFIFGKDSEKYRFQGYAIGAGISYGYQWMLTNRWNLEVNMGLGVIFLNHDKYECQTCGKLEGSERRTYFGPTRLGISLVYIIK